MKSNLIISLLTVLFIFSIKFSMAQEALSLSDALQKGLENNYQMQISKKNLQTAVNNNTWGNAGRLPSVTIGVNQNNRFDDQPFVTEMGEGRSKVISNTIVPNANLSWVIFNGFAISTTKRNLNEIQNLSEVGVAITIESTIKDVMQGYYSALLEKEKLAVYKDIMTLSKDKYDYMLYKKQLGTLGTFDVLQSKNAFLSDSSNYLLQRINYENSVRNLKLLMADNSEVVYNLTDEFVAEAKVFDKNELKLQMQQNNLLLKSQRTNQIITDNSLKLTSSSRYPVIALNSGTDYIQRRTKLENIDASSSYSYDFYAYISVSYSLFDGWNRNRKIKNAKIQTEISRLETQELEMIFNNQLSTLYEMYNLRKQLLNVANENVESTILNLQIAEDKYKSGAINSFNYRDIQLIYMNAAINKLRATYDLISADTEVMKIIGKLIEEK